MSKHLTEWTTSFSAPADLLAALDSWRRSQPDLPNRREAIRRLLAIALTRSAE